MTKAAKVTIIILLSFLAVLIYTSSLFFSRDLPSADHGRLDLSSWDFDQDGIVKLNGEWECYDGQLLAPDAFSGTTVSKPSLTGYARLTASGWKDSKSVVLDPKGVRTYRLLVKIKPSEEPFGMTINNIRMSNKLYVNGSIKGSCGNPDERDRGYVPKNAAYNAYFGVTGDKIEILIQTANFDYPFRSNNSYTIILGNQKDIDFQRTGVAASELSCAALSFFFGVYYLYLFLTGGKKRGEFYSSTQFIFLGVLLLFTGQKLIYGIFPDMPFELFCKLQLLSLVGVSASTAVYTNFTEKRILSDFLLRAILFIFSVYAIIVIAANYEISSYLNGLIYAFICAIYLYISLKLWMAYHKMAQDTILRKEVLLYLLCTGCLFVAFFGNFLNNLTLISTRFAGMLGFSVFLFLSLIFLAFRFRINYENMVKMDKLKDEFIIQTSYELKAPLYSILNLSGRIFREYGEGSFSQENYIGNAVLTKNIVQRLLDIVDTVLDVALLRNGQLKIRTSPVDMKVCADLAVESAMDLMTDVKIEISSEITKSLFAMADESRVRQILWNLILNSMKSMERGTIWIRGRQERDKVFLSVEDNGCGIPKDKWEEIFQPYTTLKAAGIGLGLYVSRQLVYLMQGDLYVEWSEVNRGTRIVLCLPGAEAENEGKWKTLVKKIRPPEAQKQKLLKNPSQNRSKGAAQKAGNTVLVVDHELFNLNTAAYILEGAGCRVLAAQTGEEALQIMETQPPDLVILDVMLPKDSGISVCKKIRETYSLIEMPVLLSVVGTESRDISLGLAAGANDFIVKPFQAEEVKARTSNLIKLKEAMDEAVKSEMAFLHAQIKPHFLYNAINTMVSFCYTDSEKAAKLLTDFSKYLRLTFDVDYKRMMIPLSREIELIGAYVAIEQARFGDKVKICYDVDSELLNMEIPPLCIQPLVENAIKHGLCKKQAGGTVFVSVKKKESGFLMEVRDDGAGMTEEKLESLKRMGSGNDGVGFSNISKRMKKWRQAQIEIQSALGQGTAVTITVPLDTVGRGGS